MQCPRCRRYGRPCPETGFDRDELCPDCADAERRETREARAREAQAQRVRDEP